MRAEEKCVAVSLIESATLLRDCRAVDGDMEYGVRVDQSHVCNGAAAAAA